MPKLKLGDMRAIDNAFEMHSGYVLDFSDRTFAEYFDGEFSIDIADPKYAFNGSSKAKRLRAFIELEASHLVAKVLRSLWDYKSNLPSREGVWASAPKDATEVKAHLFDVITKVEHGNHLPRLDALDKFKIDETLEELLAAIERDITANKPEAALDRLHTYCMKRFAHLLENRGVLCDWNDPLHSRVGRYLKELQRERFLHEISERIIKSSISIFEQFNDVRNHQSFAHDNTLIGKAEARFIFDAISAILRFIKSFEADRFEK